MKIPLIFVPPHRKKTGGLRTGKGSFPVGSDSSEKCGKTDGFGLEKQAKRAFLPLKTASHPFSDSLSGCPGNYKQTCIAPGFGVYLRDKTTIMESSKNAFRSRDVTFSAGWTDQCGPHRQSHRHRGLHSISRFLRLHSNHHKHPDVRSAPGILHTPVLRQLHLFRQSFQDFSGKMSLQGISLIGKGYLQTCLSEFPGYALCRPGIASITLPVRHAVRIVVPGRPMKTNTR